MNALSKCLLAVAMAAAAPVFAEDDHASHHVEAGAPAAADAAQSEGEVRKISKDTGKITIRHGELKNLGMPPMTMVFRVQDAAMLDQVKVGDRIVFVAEKINGQFVVMKLEPVRQ